MTAVIRGAVEPQSQAGYNSGNDLFRCGPCNKECPGELSFSQHCQSKAHAIRAGHYGFAGLTPNSYGIIPPLTDAFLRDNSRREFLINAKFHRDLTVINIERCPLQTPASFTVRGKDATSPWLLFFPPSYATPSILTASPVAAPFFIDPLWRL
jgi:hypothetical protein